MKILHDFRYSALLIFIIGILTISVTIAVHFRDGDKRDLVKQRSLLDIDDETRNLYQLPDDKFFTHTYESTGDYFRVAGMAHCQSCLEQLVTDAYYTNRKAVLPPPHVMLCGMHNNEKNIPYDVTWDRYFNMEPLERTGLVSLKEHRGVFEHSEDPGKLRTMDANVTQQILSPLDTLMDKDDGVSDVLVVNHYNDESDPRLRTFACVQETSNKLSYDQKRQMGLVDLWQPSDHVIDQTMRIVQQFPSGFIAVHIRRGDVVADIYNGQYYGYDRFAMRKVTQVGVVKRALAVYGSDLPVIAFTNENREDYLEELVTNVRNRVYLETDLDFGEFGDDNYFVALVCSHLFKVAKYRISTIVDKMGKSDLYLKDFVN